MLYFDTDVLVHYSIVQNIELHENTKLLIEKSAKYKIFFISLLSLQELSFVLEKLKQTKDVINSNLDIFAKTNPVIYNFKHFQRAREIADKIGFKHINDCIHTAIAEEFCTELITYNRDDFNKIRNYSKIKITIL